MAEIFVFGSNFLGIHKKGAALFAYKNHGAILGQGEGQQGNSYGIPTKMTPSKSMSLFEINESVARFLNYASCSPGHTYLVTEIGCGLAGWHAHQIAPMFMLVRIMKNVKITENFAEFVDPHGDFPEIVCTFSGY